MAETPTNSLAPAWLTRLAQYQSMFVPIAFIGLVAVLVVPMHPLIMDILIAGNLTIATVVLLTTIYVTSPLEFSVFPSLLLGTTLLRLVLNIATTRLILSADATSAEQATDVAGKVIETFALFVTGNNIIVGLILFIILIVVQFVVITKGATRISEVAARFTLDGMPGKQMAIDADLNAGMIDEKTARERRENIAQEADFYGAMDGAAKFVRGDAVAGIIITVINVVGGFAIGVLQKGWSAGESLEVFTRLTIGDGLVSQLPAFIISIAAGLIVTRSSGKTDLGTELSQQLTSRTAALGITAGFLCLMAFTGLPPVPMLTLAATVGGIAFVINRDEKKKKAAVAKAAAAPQEPTAPTVEQTLNIETMQLKVGYGLVALIDKSQGGTLLDRISRMRHEIATELGLVMPPVRIQDDMQYQPNEYQILIRGNTIGRGIVYPDRLIAINNGLVNEPLQGIESRDPVFGLEAVWIESGQRQRAESLNYTVVDATHVLATHLSELVKNHAPELLTREETSNLVTQVKERAPKLCDEVLTGETPIVKPGELQKILQNLLRERVPIRDLETVIETLGDWATRTKDLDVLTEYVRNALRRTICNLYVEHVPTDAAAAASGDITRTVPRLYCVSLDPMLEDQINSFIDRAAEGTTLTMPPAVANRITSAIIGELQNLIQQGHHPVVLASPQVRAQVRRIIEPHLPNVAVLGYNEVSKGVDVESTGLVQLTPTEQGQPVGV